MKVLKFEQKTCQGTKLKHKSDVNIIIQVIFR